MNTASYSYVNDVAQPASTSSKVMPLLTSVDQVKGRLPKMVRPLLKQLQHLPVGQLMMHLPSGETLALGRAQGRQAPTPVAHLNIHSWAFIQNVLASGDIGFAEGYIRGDWSTPDLTAVLRLFLSNRAHVEQLLYGSWWGAWVYKIKHWLNRNTKTGSRKNIHAHYDLGNDFYTLWLDEGMNYSSAWFNGDTQKSMASAQDAKMRRALMEAGLQLQQGDATLSTPPKVLEIGCGWGALAQMVAEDFGANLVGITLSDEQLRYGQARMAGLGLAHQAQLIKLDYRDVVSQYGEGSFDAVVSIEMFEAVGQAYWEDYFATVAKALKSGGRACIQSITIDDTLFDRYSKSTDFIQQYVFPGGMLPSPQKFVQQAALHGLQCVNELDFGTDYAETLRQWRQAFYQRLDAVRALGFDDEFIKLWEFYLSYCEAGFDDKSISVRQFTLVKA